MALELDPIEIPAGQPSGLQLDPVNTVIKPIPLPKQPEAPLQMPPTFTNAINSLSKMSAPAINFISDMQQPRIPPPPQPDIFANAPGFSLPAPSKPTIDFSAPSQSYPSSLSDNLIAELKKQPQTVGGMPEPVPINRELTSEEVKKISGEFVSNLKKYNPDTEESDRNVRNIWAHMGATSAIPAILINEKNRIRLKTYLDYANGQLVRTPETEGIFKKFERQFPKGVPQSVVKQWQKEFKSIPGAAETLGQRLGYDELVPDRFNPSLSTAGGAMQGEMVYGTPENINPEAFATAGTFGGFAEVPFDPRAYAIAKILSPVYGAIKDAAIKRFPKLGEKVKLPDFRKEVTETVKDIKGAAKAAKEINPEYIKTTRFSNKPEPSSIQLGKKEFAQAYDELLSQKHPLVVNADGTIRVAKTQFVKDMIAYHNELDKPLFDVTKHPSASEAAFGEGVKTTNINIGQKAPMSRSFGLPKNVPEAVSPPPPTVIEKGGKLYKIETVRIPAIETGTMSATTAEKLIAKGRELPTVPVFSPVMVEMDEKGNEVKTPIDTKGQKFPTMESAFNWLNSYLEKVPVAEPTAPEPVPIAPTAPEITQEAPKAPPIAEAPVPVTPEAPAAGKGTEVPAGKEVPTLEYKRQPEKPKKKTTTLKEEDRVSWKEKGGETQTGTVVRKVKGGYIIAPDKTGKQGKFTTITEQKIQGKYLTKLDPEMEEIKQMGFDTDEDGIPVKKDDGDFNYEEKNVSEQTNEEKLKIMTKFFGGEENKPAATKVTIGDKNFGAEIIKKDPTTGKIETLPAPPANKIAQALAGLKAVKPDLDLKVDGKKVEAGDPLDFLRFVGKTLGVTDIDVDQKKMYKWANLEDDAYRPFGKNAKKYMESDVEEAYDVYQKFLKRQEELGMKAPEAPAGKAPAGADTPSANVRSQLEDFYKKGEETYTESRFYGTEITFKNKYGEVFTTKIHRIHNGGDLLEVHSPFAPDEPQATVRINAEDVISIDKVVDNKAPEIKPDKPVSDLSKGQKEFYAKQQREAAIAEEKFKEEVIRQEELAKNTPKLTKITGEGQYYTRSVRGVNIVNGVGKNIDGVDVFIHKDGKEWRVSSTSTGIMITKGRTRKEALESFQSVNKDFLLEKLAEAEAKYGSFLPEKAPAGADAGEYKAIKAGSNIIFTDGASGQVVSFDDANVEFRPAGQDDTISIPRAEFNDRILSVGDPKTEKLRAGISPADLDPGTLQKIVRWIKKWMSPTGALEPDAAREALVAREAIKESEATAAIMGKRLTKGLTEKQQQAIGKVVIGDYPDAGAMAKAEGIPLKEAKDLFKLGREAADIMTYFGEELAKRGLLTKESLAKYGGIYMGRLFRKWEYRHMPTELLNEIAEMLLKKGDPQGKKWAEVAMRLADREKQFAFEQTIQDEIRKAANDPTLSSDTKLPGFTKVMGEDWLYTENGEIGLAGRWVRDDIYKTLKASIDNARLSRKKLGKWMNAKSSDLGEGMDMSYLKQRKDLPDEYREFLGEILEPAYPIARRIQQMGEDIAKYDFYDYMAKNYSSANNLGGKLKRVEGKAFGKLEGRYMLPEYVDSIKEYEEMSGFWGKLNQGLKLWKELHTVWSPGTHSRNVQNNVMTYCIIYGFSAIEEVAPTIGNFVNDDTLLEIAKRANVFGGSYFEEKGGTKQFIDNFADIKDMEGFLKKLLEVVNVRAHAKAAYKFGDDFFKLMAFRRELKAAGIDIEKLTTDWNKMTFREQREWIKNIGAKPSVEARNAITSYDRMGKLPRLLSQYPGSLIPVGGDPFISFPYSFATRTIPKIFKQGAGSQLRFLLALLIPAAVAAYTWHKNQTTAQKEIAQRPEYMRKTSDWAKKKGMDEKYIPLVSMLFDGYLPLPFKDKHGRNLYWDSSNTLAWQDLAKVDENTALIKDPVSRTIAEISANKNFFTNQKIWLDSDSEEVILKKKAMHIWRAAAPSFAPGGYSWEKWKAAYRGAEDYYGRTRDKGMVALDTLLGIKITPVEPKTTAYYEIKKDRESLEELWSKTRQVENLRDRKTLSPKEAEKELIYLKERIRTVRN